MTRSRRQVEAARKKRLQGKAAKAAGKKDPGVPQLGRFAAHIQQQNERKQKRAAEARRRQEEARGAELGRRRSLAGLQHDALRRQRDFERKEVTAAQPDAQDEASLRQYGRELRKVLAASDVVLEVLDARDPQGCRSPQLEAAVRRAGARQRLVLVLNKIDLVPRDVVAAWLKYLRAEFPTVAFKACTQQQSRNLKQSRLPVTTAPEEVLAGGGSVGADCLLRVLANYSRSREVKTAITVGVVGYPNVGKSSLINSLKRSRVCGVGATPGVTRCLQAVQLDRHIQLLDCPGVVMETGAPPAAAPLRGALAPQRLKDPLGPAAAILHRCPPQQLSELYGVPPCADPRQFLSHLARRQGRLRPGGLPDPHAAAVALLHDWTSGKISYYTHPPERDEGGAQLEARILPALGPELDLEALERGDAEALAAVPVEVEGIEMAACGPEEEEEEEEGQEEAMERDGGAEADGDGLEFGALTVELKPRAKPGGGHGGGCPPPAPPVWKKWPRCPPCCRARGWRPRASGGKSSKKEQKKSPPSCRRR
ncbi:LOW QUALITY PROTEIN: guanine nucleotide-binding protein-like 3-like protein [Anas acuta]|uniref:LOW QUALITY PROTEIN: guanine nucleotide-binding protein-like 3-like protein n=1 Tax=Anas acuta TaxID=28680 RepID=UPI0035C90318